MTHLYPGFGLQVCSISIPPAAGAPYTAVDGHETPRAQCSVDKIRHLGRRTATARWGSSQVAEELDCSATCEKGSPHLFIKTY